MELMTFLVSASSVSLGVQNSPSYLSTLPPMEARRPDNMTYPANRLNPASASAFPSGTLKRPSLFGVARGGGAQGGRRPVSLNRLSAVQNGEASSTQSDERQQPHAWQKALVAGLASSVVTGVNHPVSNVINKAMADGLRLPSVSDFTYRGFNANVARVFVKWSALDGMNRAFTHAIKQIVARTPLKDREDVVSSVSAGLTAIMVALMLCPVERVRQYQVMRGGGFVQGARSLMREGGVSSFFKGALTAGLNTLPNLMIRSFAERLAGGDKVKEKQISGKLSMMMAPVRTYLTAVKQTQQTHGTGAAKAYMDTLMAAIHDPRKLLFHVAMGLIFVRICNELFYGVQNTLESMIPSQHKKPAP